MFLKVEDMLACLGSMVPAVVVTYIGTFCGTLRKPLEQVAEPDCKRDDFKPATHARKEGRKE